MSCVLLRQDGGRRSAWPTQAAGDTVSRAELSTPSGDGVTVPTFSPNGPTSACLLLACNPSTSTTILPAEMNKPPGDGVWHWPHWQVDMHTGAAFLAVHHWQGLDAWLYHVIEKRLKVPVFRFGLPSRTADAADSVQMADLDSDADLAERLSISQAGVGWREHSVCTVWCTCCQHAVPVLRAS